ncbi:hypothetical protein EBT31_07145 [bacterium]|jgi:hypothetical protein|nr:hypothetical protein [bacterium]
MPKKKMPAVVEGIPTVPPADLNPEEKKCYAVLHSQVARSGHVSNTSLESFLLLVHQRARLNRIRREVDALDSWMIAGSTGQGALHPMVKELRQMETAYANQLGKLLMDPRSKVTSRAKEDQVLAVAGDNPILRSLG